MVNRTKNTNSKKTQGHGQGRIGQSGGHCTHPDPEKENHHHLLATPAISQPPCWQSAQAEYHQCRCRIGNKLRIAHPPFPGQHQRRSSGKDQGQQVINEMTGIEKGKMQARIHE